MQAVSCRTADDGKVGSPGAVKVLVVNGWRHAHDGIPAGVYTKNVVYREVF
jgi:hypothetical protein